MQKVIARKKHSAGVLFILLTLLGVGLLALGIACNIMILLVLGAAFAVGCIGFAVWYLTVPSAIIALDENGNLVLPRGVTIAVRDITDVFCFTASSLHRDYQFGSVTIETKTRKYKYGFVADCENVAKELNALRPQKIK